MGTVDIAAELAISRQMRMRKADKFVADTSCGGHQSYRMMEHEREQSFVVRIMQ